MANETVLFKRGDSATITSTPVTDGQILFDTSGNGKMYLDNGTDRLEMGGAITVDASLSKTSTNAIQNKAVTGNILNSLAEVSAATQQNTIAGALALKEVNSSLGGLKFGKDGEGNYGYFGDDDVLIPFSGGNLVILGYAHTPNGTYATLFVADKNYDHVYVAGQSFNVFLKNGNAYSPTNLVNTAYYSSIYDLEDIKAGDTISVNGGSTGTHSSTAFVIV